MESNACPQYLQYLQSILIMKLDNGRNSLFKDMQSVFQFSKLVPYLRGEDHMTRNFIRCTPHQMLFGCSHNEEWDGRVM
jgi:hypothetical protein